MNATFEESKMKTWALHVPTVWAETGNLQQDVTETWNKDQGIRYSNFSRDESFHIELNHQRYGSAKEKKRSYPREGFMDQ